MGGKGVGWKVGAGGELKAGSSIYWNRKTAIVFSKGTQCTCQIEVVVGGSFIPSVA